jgi:hypothetical protein
MYRLQFMRQEYSLNKYSQGKEALEIYAHLQGEDNQNLAGTFRAA